jgi:excisionase family DNA binding protein
MLPHQQQNVESDLRTDDGDCSVCQSLLANLQQFFGMLEDARRPPDSEWITVEEVAQELKVSRSIVYRIIRSGDLAAVDIVDSNGRVAKKGHYRIRRSSLDRYLESKRVKAPQNQTV